MSKPIMIGLAARLFLPLALLLAGPVRAAGEDEHLQVREQLEAAADDGDATAQYRLGNLYMKGDFDTEVDYDEAFKWYRKSARQGHPEGTFNLGTCYDQGLGVEADQDRAFELFLRAADLGMLEAQRTMGFLFRDRLKSPEKAVAYFRLAAGQGDLVSIREYGRCLLLGQGTGAKRDQAAKLLERAAGLGDMPAQLLLADFYSQRYEQASRAAKQEEDPEKARELAGQAADYGERMIDYLWQASSYNAEGDRAMEQLLGEALGKMAYCYEHGIGVAADDETARKWYEKSAGLGYAPAMVNLAHHYAGQGLDQEAAELYEEAARLSHPLGLYHLGVIHEQGRGVEQNDARARELYEQAALAGQPDAQFRLGLCYELGLGTEPDADKAFHWYHQAARSGHRKALLHTARCHERGLGTEPNPGVATVWYRRAAKAGDPEAMFAYARHLEAGDGGEADPGSALHWYHQAAEAEHAPAMFQLGRCYEKGIGTKPDPVLAFHWYHQAAKTGDSQAMLGVAHCYLDGVGVEKDPEKASAWLEWAAEKKDPLAMDLLKRLRD